MTELLLGQREMPLLPAAKPVAPNPRDVTPEPSPHVAALQQLAAAHGFTLINIAPAPPSAPAAPRTLCFRRLVRGQPQFLALGEHTALDTLRHFFGEKLAP